MSADTAEKCFHNALILIDCCRKIGLDYDINSLDITDPNSISMSLFTAYLFNRLPNYIPSATVDLSSPLHQTASKHVSHFKIIKTKISIYTKFYLKKDKNLKSKHKKYLLWSDYNRTKRWEFLIAQRQRSAYTSKGKAWFARWLCWK